LHIALKVTTGIVAGASLLTFAFPILGEVIATFPPAFRAGAPNPVAELGLPYEDVEFPTTDGLTLRGWFIPAGRADAPGVLYAPATRHDQRSGVSLAPAFHRAGYHVLLFSYRGHALSDGKRGHFTYGDAESRDVDAAVQFLYETKGIRRIGVIGHSAGAVSSIMSAARNPLVGAVVAVAPFNSLDEVWHTSRPALVPAFVLDWTLLVAEQVRGFRSEDVWAEAVVDRIAPRPLLVIHGKDDERITESQVRRLFAAAEEPKTLWLVEGATHKGIRDPVLDRLAPNVIGFLDKALQRQSVQGSALAQH
jgi:alpha-beta hydrolase superfamily lysophospholipase